MRLEPLRGLLTKLRLVFTLVPWRMRPKLILLLIGSVASAGMDLLAVLMVLPVMQLVSGTSIEQSGILKVLSRWSGITEPQSLLVATLVAVVLLMVAKNIFSVLFRWWSLGVMARAESDTTQTVMSLYMNAPFVHHRRRPTEDIYQVLNIYIHAVISGITAGLITLVADLITSLALFVGLLVLSPLATVVAAVFFGGASLLIQRTLRPRQTRIGEEMRTENLRGWSYLGPAIDGFKEVRLAGASQRFADAFSESRRKVAYLARTAAVLGEVPRYLLEVMMILGILVISLVLFATTTVAGTLAFLGVFAAAAMRLVPTLNRMLGTLGVIITNLPNLNSFVEEIQTLREQADAADVGGAGTQFPPADITFENLTFTYPDGTTPVLDQVSGTIPAGSTVALVGGSGAGKTTFVELLLTLFTPDQGSITVGGHRIHDEPSAWQGQLGMVAQDVYLQDRSIRENIAFGVPRDRIDEDRVHQAIRMAELEDFIATMPQGLDTQVGHRGARVSGGQKQRIGIARALYRQPQVLVLDEATSALDNETEARITKTIQALHGKMTIVIVAHRLSTVKHADQILFFSGGRIAARGTMAELTASNAEFAELVRLGRLT